MSIRFQILIPLLLVIVASAGVSVYIAIDAKEKNQAIELVVDNSLQARSDSSALLVHFQEAARYVDQVLAMSTFIPADEMATTFAGRIERVTTTLDALLAADLTADVSQGAQSLAASYAQWEESAQQALGLTPSTTVPTREKLNRERAAVETGIKNVDSLVAEAADTLTAAASAELASDIRTGLTLAFGLAAVFLVLGVVVAHGIARPLSQMTRAMSRLSAGEYDVALPKSRRSSEIRHMLAAVTVFKENALEREKLASETEKAQIERRRRASEMENMLSQLNTMIEATVHGDFSKRVDATFEDSDLQRAASMLNELVATVDHNIAETGRIIGALADGDLSGRLDASVGGAFGRLNQSINTTMDNLSSLIRAMGNTSGVIGEVSDKLKADSDQLSHRSSQQAASVEETAATLEEMQATSKSVNDRASDAQGLAGETRAKTESSLAVVNNAVEAMGRIEEASEEIGRILEIIDQISFQTNLLALNAGVEAARAGDAGAGFAVVAHEVRELAQRSTASANDIKQLIDRTRAEIGKGVSLVNSTGESLADLQSKVVTIDENITSIVTAIREQYVGIEGLNGTVQQIDKLTQQNTSMVLETTNAIEQMTHESGELSRLLARFSLDETVEARQVMAA